MDHPPPGGDEGARFERLLADLSARFVNLPPAEVRNVRELRNIIERATIVSAGPALHVELPSPPDQQPSTAMTLEAVERRHITAVLEDARWRIRGEGGAAQRLGLKPSTLEFRMRKLGITR